MSGITDELRGFMAGADGYELWCPRHKAELTEIADRIDTENAELRKFAADMLRLLKAISAKYPRLFDPNLSPGGMMVRANPVYVFMERARELGVDGE